MNKEEERKKRGEDWVYVLPSDEEASKKREERLRRRAKLPVLCCKNELKILSSKDSSLNDCRDALYSIQKSIDSSKDPEMRGLNKGAELCNSLLQNSGLDVLESVKSGKYSNELGKTAEGLIAQFVPMIWS